MTPLPRLEFRGTNYTLSGKIVLFMLVPCREFLSSDDIYSDSTLMIGLINVQLFNVFKVCLNSRRWFVLCLVCIPYLVLVLVSGLGTSSIGRVHPSRFHLKGKKESILRNVVF
jgi:hypothetical protein